MRHKQRKTSQCPSQNRWRDYSKDARDVLNAGSRARRTCNMDLSDPNTRALRHNEVGWAVKGGQECPD